MFYGRALQNIREASHPRISEDFWAKSLLNLHQLHIQESQKPFAQRASEILGCEVSLCFKGPFNKTIQKCSGEVSEDFLSKSLLKFLDVKFPYVLNGPSIKQYRNAPDPVLLLFYTRAVSKPYVLKAAIEKQYSLRISEESGRFF